MVEKTATKNSCGNVLNDQLLNAVVPDKTITVEYHRGNVQNIETDGKCKLIRKSAHKLNFA